VGPAGFFPAFFEGAKQMELMTMLHEQEEVVSLGSTVVDFAKATIERGGTRVSLSMKEFLLLRYLFEHRGFTVPRECLLRDVLGFQTNMTRTLDMHIANLRKKIEADPAHPRLILTVPRAGYRLESTPLGAEPLA